MSTTVAPPRVHQASGRRSPRSSPLRSPTNHVMSSNDDDLYDYSDSYMPAPSSSHNYFRTHPGANPRMAKVEVMRLGDDFEARLIKLRGDFEALLEELLSLKREFCHR